MVLASSAYFSFRVQPHKSLTPKRSNGVRPILMSPQALTRRDSLPGFSVCLSSPEPAVRLWEDMSSPEIASCSLEANGCCSAISWRAENSCLRGRLLEPGLPVLWNCVIVERLAQGHHRLHGRAPSRAPPGPAVIVVLPCAWKVNLKSPTFRVKSMHIKVRDGIHLDHLLCV